MRMIALQFFLTLLVTAELPLPSLAVTCEKSVLTSPYGWVDTATSTCEGNYCFSMHLHVNEVSGGTINPSSRMLKEKGCIRGNLFVDSAVQMDACLNHQSLQFDDTHQNQVCFCNRTNLCNRDESTLKQVTVNDRLVTCSCVGHAYCGANGQCIGSVCTHSVNQATKEVKKGCINATTGTVQGTLTTECVAPGIVDDPAADLNKLLNVETCMCSTAFCNRKDLKKLMSNSSDGPKSRCVMKVGLDILGIESRQSSERSCLGDFCMETTMDASNQMVRVRSQGCLTLPKKAMSPNAIQPSIIKVGCMEVETTSASAKICFTKN